VEDDLVAFEATGGAGDVGIRGETVRFAVTGPAPEGGADGAAREFQIGEEGVLDLVADRVDHGAGVVAGDAFGFEGFGIGADLLAGTHRVGDEGEGVAADVDRAAAAGVEFAVAPGGAGDDLVGRPIAADTAGNPELRVADQALADDPTGSA